MTQTGWMLIKIRKQINIYLFSKDKEVLEGCCKKGMQIVPYYEDDDGRGYIVTDDCELLRIV